MQKSKAVLDNNLIFKDTATHQEEKCKCLFLNKLSDANTQDARHGLSLLMAVVFVLGELAGSGMLALPYAVSKAGWIGLVLIVACFAVSSFTGSLLGQCWIMLRERYPEYRGTVRYPYPAIGQVAFGKPGRWLVSISIFVTLFGACVVYLILIGQNLVSIFSAFGVTSVSFCIWLIIIAAVLTPFTWFGTPKDFWLIAGAAVVSTLVAGLLILATLSRVRSASHSSPEFLPFFTSFGTIIFAYGGQSIFPTIQHDMKEPNKFSRVVVIGYAGITCLYLPIAALGYFTLGDNVATNVLQSLPRDGLRYAAEVLLVLHFLSAFVIICNPVSQELEEILHIPHKFGWKRCALRTGLIAFILLVAETIPHFGALLNLVGGSSVTLLTFILPCVFYVKLCAMAGEWKKRFIPLHYKVIIGEIILVGVLGGTASTIAAIQTIVAPNTFVPPCFINSTLAGSR